MISEKEHPVAWALIISEMEEACEHLRSLIDEMAKQGLIDEEVFAVDLGHIFAHLNRVWNARSDPESENWTGDVWERNSQFPDDLKPVG